MNRTAEAYPKLNKLPLALQPHFAAVACPLRDYEARRGMETALKQIKDWTAELETLWEKVAPRFGRVEVRRRASGFLRGLLGNVGRKNGSSVVKGLR